MNQCIQSGKNLSPFTTDSPSELDILRHDGDSLSMNSTQVGVLKQTYKISLGSLLKCKHSVALEPQISLPEQTNT